MSLSVASSWAWGVSVIVGMEIFSKKGIEAFVIWAFANSIALLLFGWVTKNTDGKLMSDILPRSIQPIYKILGLVIQFFSVLVNLTALEMAARMIGLPEWILLVFAVLLFAIIWVGGFPKAVIGGALQFIGSMAFILFALTFNSEPHLLFSDQQYGWALWSAIILLSGPFLDQQIWQRRSATRGRVKPFVWAALWFAGYMGFVGLLSYKGIGGWVIGAIVVFVAGSTLLSAYSAISSYGKTRIQSKIWMTGVVAGAFLTMTLHYSVLDLWTMYGSMRIPFAVIVVGCLFLK